MRSARGELTLGKVAITRLPRARVDESGLTILTETRECDRSIFLNVLPKMQSPHPDFTRLVLKEIEWGYLPNFRAEYTLTYKGIPQEELPEPVYTLSASTAQEDIRTFPTFELLAGTPDIPLNGAVFNEETSFFEGFGSTADPSFRGVQSYFAPSVVATKVSYSATEPDAGVRLGKIDNPGFSLATSQLTGNQNYVKLSSEVQTFGDIWQLSESWLRSGDLGWNFLIYGI